MSYQRIDRISEEVRREVDAIIREEQELARIYALLDISPHPMGTRKFVGPPKIPPEKSSN